MVESTYKEGHRGNGGVGFAWAGWIISSIVTRFAGEYWLIPYTIGLILAVVGCVLWAQRKNRHWAFGFCGILAPIGFIVIALLKEKQFNNGIEE